jgi:hypothetical protein
MVSVWDYLRLRRGRGGQDERSLAAILARPAAAPGSGVRAHITNSGRRAGSDVVQLYLAFPEPAGERPRQLR